MSFPPLVTPPLQPLDLTDVSVSLLPRTVGRMVGEGRARDAVRERMFRPADLEDNAELGPVEEIWVPMWRVKGSADSFSLDLVTAWESRRERPDAVVLGGPGRVPPDRSRDDGRAAPGWFRSGASAITTGRSRSSLVVGFRSILGSTSRSR